ncbi:transposase [Streptomyces sviceus]|uniref:transposase n=1 Tax=Streptomyces sp. SID5470 TaxID=2690297 RepID=UPI001FD84438|nr:transposase [Streptomyces sviceus]
MIVADCGYGRSVAFRLALEEHGWSYVMAVEPEEIARPAGVEPHLPPYRGLGPPTLPRYREPARPLRDLVGPATRLETVTRRQGSKGSMTSRCAVLEMRPLGQGSHPHRAGTRRRTQPVQWRTAAADPAGRTARRSRRAHRLLHDQSARHHSRRRSGALRQHALALEHDHRELKHRLGLDHFEGRTWRGRHHHGTLVTATQAFLTLRRHDPKALTPA